MRVVATEDGSIVTITPDGALDDELAKALAETADQALENGRTRFVLNLQRVPQSSSVGLEVIVRLARKVADADGRLALVGVGEVMLDILRATRLDRRLAVFDSTESAMQTMTSEA